MSKNHEILLASRPVGAPTAENFTYRETARPKAGPGEVLLRLLWLSVDPYIRGRMNEGKSYAAPLVVGEPIVSGGVAEVMESNNPAFPVGAHVSGRIKWAEWQTHDGEDLTLLDPADGWTKDRLSYALGVLGMPGMTAWVGLNVHGRPKKGETIVVSAVTGAVGSVVAQLAKRRGLRVVGVAGGPEKCAYAVETLGCDACVDHRDPELKAKLAAACPDGVDIYYENVGGVTLAAVMPLMNFFSRIPVCGMISQYNATGPAEGPDRLGAMWRSILTNRISVRGFIVFDHADRASDFMAEVAPLVASGEIKTRETVTEGLASAPEAFMALLSGGNFGKAVVKVAEA
ncbi:NADP-dependent oxidoreductase [Pikeienuella sp. HZG-20]|uniref:NADP-dependent oxidoreductase n=1 Tax=Paludibacillus litoralis TaxID=3133267 RepID=UPI0030EF3221